MNELNEKRVAVLKEFLRVIYTNHDIRCTEFALTWAAELIVEALEQVELQDMIKHFHGDDLGNAPSEEVA